MKKQLAAVAAIGALALTGCSQIAQLKPVAGDAVTAVRIATIDVVENAGISVRTTPVCTFTDTDTTCKGVTADGKPILSEATKVAKTAIPPDYQSGTLDDTAPDDVIIMTVKVGDVELYRGLATTVLDKNGRSAQ